MGIIQSNARWEDEDKAMQAYLDQQDLEAEAIYDDPEAIAEAERQAAEGEAEWRAFMQELAEEQYREWVESQIEDTIADALDSGDAIGYEIRTNERGTFLTTMHRPVLTREHAMSLSAQIAQDLDATLHQTWTQDGAKGTVVYVQWRMDDPDEPGDAI